MKRIFLLALFMIIAFYGCTAKDNMNLAIFIENYNALSDTEIDFTSFTGRNREDCTEYSFFISEGNNKVFVTLSEIDKEITECRVTLLKNDSSLNIQKADKVITDLFIKAVRNVAFSFAGLNETEFENTIYKALSDFDVEENTSKYKNYNLIYVSNDLCSEFIIRNKWFYEEETTVKPENINSFLNTAPVRTETVPHR